jgi:hypothetical protein
MHAIDVTAQYSILGSPVRVLEVDGPAVVLHAPHRLGPGRFVSIRNGATTFGATVSSAHVVALDADAGATYELRVEMAAAPSGTGAQEAISRTASPAVDPVAMKKGGASRAA